MGKRGLKETAYMILYILQLQKFMMLRYIQRIKKSCLARVNIN